MRLPRMANPIKSGTSPFLPTIGTSARKISIHELILPNKLLMETSSTTTHASMTTTVADPGNKIAASTIVNPVGQSGASAIRSSRKCSGSSWGTESNPPGDTDERPTGARATTNDNAEVTRSGPAHHLVHPLSSGKISKPTSADDPQSEMKPPGFSVSAFTNPGAMSESQPPPSTDPLDLVIAKRKKKELADPVIAEAILTASKLPPPPIPETENMHEVPEEIQQLISLGFGRQSMDEAELEFLRNYPLDQKPRQRLEIPPVSQLSRYETFRRKYWHPTFRRHSDWDDEDKELPCNGTGPGFDEIGVKPKEPMTISVHTDEDWFMESVLHVMCILLIVLTLPLSLIFCLKVVAHYERAVLFRLGRLVSATAQGPGLIIVLPCLDRYRILDLRTFTFDVPTQEVLTKDSVTVVVNAVVYYRVRDPVRAVVNVEDANRATRVLGQTTLRNVLGTVNLDQLLTAREDIAALMQECLDSVTEAWGVKVERVEIKDVRLPIQLQRAMAAEAESVREATAKVIAAEGEMRASGALKAAAFEIKQHPIAMQLRYLQAMSSISSGKESTIVFPVPLDLLSLFRIAVGDVQSANGSVMDKIKTVAHDVPETRVSLESLQAVAAAMSVSVIDGSEKRLIDLESLDDPTDYTSQIV